MLPEAEASFFCSNHERDWPNTGDRYTSANAKDSGGECGIVSLPQHTPFQNQHS